MVETPANPDELWAALRLATPARVALGRVGQGLPTAQMLAFQLAHARACDAVHAVLDIERLQAELRLPTLVVETAAPSRSAYLKNPDLGRRLGPHTQSLVRDDYDLAIVIADGLSAVAVQAHAVNVVHALVEQMDGWRVGPVVIARQARVAIGDPVGQGLGARAALVLIGERPGLSAADSMSGYITWAPAPGRRDHERNCVSNIREPDGLSCRQAAAKISWLLIEARRLGFTGVQLKDRQADALVSHSSVVFDGDGDWAALERPTTFGSDA